VFQIIVIIVGLLAIIIKGLTQTGSFGNVLDDALAGGRVGWPDFGVDVYKRETFWSILFGSAILWGSPYTRFRPYFKSFDYNCQLFAFDCSAQYLVHRSLCLRNLKKAKASLYLNFVGQVALFMVVTLIGLLLYAYYIHCDPVNAGVIKKGNALVSLFVLQELSQYYGVPGTSFCNDPESGIWNLNQRKC
jgi:sodium-coupled monocarboxylate transporter 8/12